MVVFMVSMPVVRVSLVVPVVVLVARYVLLVVPIISHEIDRTTASMVFRTMLAPVLLVAGRDMQVDRRGRSVLG